MTPLARRSESYFLGCRRGLVIARVLRLPRFGSLASLIFGWDGTTRTGQNECRRNARYIRMHMGGWSEPEPTREKRNRAEKLLSRHREPIRYEARPIWEAC